MGWRNHLLRIGNRLSIIPHYCPITAPCPILAASSRRKGGILPSFGNRARCACVLIPRAVQLCRRACVSIRRRGPLHVGAARRKFVSPQEQELLSSLTQKINQTQLQEKDPDAEDFLRRELGANPDAL